MNNKTVLVKYLNQYCTENEWLIPDEYSEALFSTKYKLCIFELTVSKYILRPRERKCLSLSVTKLNRKLLGRSKRSKILLYIHKRDFLGKILNLNSHSISKQNL